MRTILRDLGTLNGVSSGYVIRDGDVVATTFGDDEKSTVQSTASMIAGVGKALASAERALDEVSVEFEKATLTVLAVDDGLLLGKLSEGKVDTVLLRAAMHSAARQIRTMLELPPPPAPEPTPAPKPAPAAKAKEDPKPKAQPEPAKEAPAKAKAEPKAKQQAKPAPKAAAKPEAAKSAKPAPSPEDADADPLLPRVLDLLTDAIGPVARVTFKQGVAQWREGNKATVGNLPKLAEILAEDLSNEKEKRTFIDAVSRLGRK